MPTHYPSKLRDGPIFMDEELIMENLSYYERLVSSVERIARHAYYPGKEQVVDQCLEDVEDLSVAGCITPEQREALRLVLLGVTLRAA
jgi:hypothetical protein